MKKVFPSDKQDQYMVRFPDGMRERIKRHAAENNRSMNAEIISLLEMALWDADRSRMESGLEPLREMTSDDKDYVSLVREDLARRQTAKDKLLVPTDLKEIKDQLSRIEGDIVEAIKNAVEDRYSEILDEVKAINDRYEADIKRRYSQSD